MTGDRASFTCPRCGATSHHAEDGWHGYCGRCHAFTGAEGTTLLPMPGGWGDLPPRSEIPIVPPGGHGVDPAALRTFDVWTTPFEPPARLALLLPLRPGGPGRIGVAAAIITVYGVAGFLSAGSGPVAVVAAMVVLAMGTFGVGKVAGYVALGAAIDRSVFDGWEVSRARFGINALARWRKAIVTRAKNPRT